MGLAGLGAGVAGLVGGKRLPGQLHVVQGRGRGCDGSEMALRGGPGVGREAGVGDGEQQGGSSCGGESGGETGQSGPAAPAPGASTTGSR